MNLYLATFITNQNNITIEIKANNWNEAVDKAETIKIEKKYISVYSVEYIGID